MGQNILKVRFRSDGIGGSKNYIEQLQVKSGQFEEWSFHGPSILKLAIVYRRFGNTSRYRIDINALHTALRIHSQYGLMRVNSTKN